MPSHESNFLPFALPDIGDAEIAAAVEAMRSGWLTTGPNVAAFEREFSDRLGDNVHAVAVSSATAGLHLALEAVGIGPGAEVLVPTWTFTACAEVVRYMGADPVFVDIEPETLNLDISAASDATTGRTRAVMPVHFAGLPVARKSLQKLADDRDLIIVEDAAHAFPASSDGAIIGSGGSAATVFSFYATKTITTGEGGMIATRDEGVAARARVMRLHGISRDVFDRYRSTSPSWTYEVVAPGYKYNMTDPAAAMGRVQLGRATEMGASRERIANSYFEGLQGLPVTLPVRAPLGDLHAWHLFVIRLKDEARVDRDRFIERMAEEGVGCSVHFIPLHMQPFWRDRYALRDGDFPVATEQFARAVSLPIFSKMTDGEVSRVIETVHRVLN